MKLREMLSNQDDLVLLRRFYEGLYAGEFPDPDERESYENMVGYLQGGTPKENGYHVLLALEAEEVLGGSISDYFAFSNSGVIEFLVIAVKRRGEGLGSLLLQSTEDLLVTDAARGGRKLERVMAEINDPFRPAQTPDNVNPFVRARWWDRRGYRRLDFPYVQPALSAEQRPVDHLLLCAKEFQAKDTCLVPAASVDAFVRDYLTFAMRIADPMSSAEYRAMHAWLSTHKRVRLDPLRAYIGEDPLQAAQR